MKEFGEWYCKLLNDLPRLACCKENTYDISLRPKAEVDKFHEENCLVKDVGVEPLAVQGSLLVFKNTLIQMEF